MTNLKINSTSTPYWCVVVPVEAEDIIIAPNVLFACIRYFVPNADKTPPYDIRFIKTYIRYNRGKALKLLGCITSSGMDEGVREMVGKIHVEDMPSPYNDMSGGFHYDYIDYMNQGDYAGWQGDANSFRKPHPSALSLLQHNQITLTTAQKAVVVKQIT